MKHSAVEMRRILGAQRDMFQRLVTLSLEADRETTAYYRDVYDHIIRQYETVDSLRDLLTGAMDVYLSTVSNRLNMTVKALTVVASLFLPLTFLTGFFGMNFGWLVTRIGSGSRLRHRPCLMAIVDHHAAGVLPATRLDLMCEDRALTDDGRSTAGQP